ncbi:hypothetical protein BDR05DRAFT_952495 [Suillus weaverae]|nr:hypothetical protein BDR05DRAFT_952495 [Suillus weaverae]
MDRFSKEVVETEHCEPCKQVKTGDHYSCCAEAYHEKIIVHDKLGVDEERTEDIRKVEGDALGLGWVCGPRYIYLYVSDLLLMADWSAGVGGSGESVLIELRGHIVSGTGRFERVTSSVETMHENHKLYVCITVLAQKVATCVPYPTRHRHHILQFDPLRSTVDGVR